MNNEEKNKAIDEQLEYEEAKRTVKNRFERWAVSLLESPTERQKAEEYTKYFEISNYYDLGNEFKEYAEIATKQRLWTIPKEIDISSANLKKFPFDTLSGIPKKYIAAAATGVQLFPEMLVLPFMSSIAAAVMHSAYIERPDGSGDSIPVSMYTCTASAVSERKSSALSAFLKPLEEFYRKENTSDEFKNKLAMWKAEKRVAASELKRLESFKKAETDSEIEAAGGSIIDRIKDAEYKLQELEDNKVSEFNPIVEDITTEALAISMQRNKECAVILSDEPTIFENLSGLYNGGRPQSLTLLCKGFNELSFRQERVTRDAINLERPIIALGLIVQTDAFRDAMNIKPFLSKGFIQRFLFAFPDGYGKRKMIAAAPMSQSVKDEYRKMLFDIMEGCKESPYRLRFSSGCIEHLQKYYDELEDKRTNEKYGSNLREWYGKHFDRYMCIAAILHLTENAGNVQPEINEETALRAISISKWTEEQAVFAFGDNSQDEKEAIELFKKIKSEFKKSGKKELASSHFSVMKLRTDKKESGLFDTCIGILENFDYLQTEERGRKTVYHINPYI